MSLFGFGKQKASPAAPQAAPAPADGTHRLKVLGSGCKSCHALLESAKTAASRMESPLEVEYITDLQDILSYGVMRTPALVLDQSVLSMGRLLTADQVEQLLREQIQ